MFQVTPSFFHLLFVFFWVVEVALLVEDLAEADVMGVGAGSFILPYLCFHDYLTICTFLIIIEGVLVNQICIYIL